jgi:hypothetical protein
MRLGERKGMKPSKVHTCVFQEQVAMGKKEPIVKKCRCKQVINYEEANDRVKRGEALWVVTKRERGAEERICTHCHGVDPRACDRCKGTGKINVAVVWDDYNGDIAMINHRTKSNRISTPKTPTIESEHILRFVVFEGEADKTAKEAKERIEEYGRMIQWSLQELGAELRAAKTGEILIEGRPEPANFRKTYKPGELTFRDGSKNTQPWTVTEGRDYDYGRTT